MSFANIDAEYEKHSQLRPADVAKLQEWQRMQPHLPAPLHPIEAAIFLQYCCYKIESAKRCIDAFYTFRTQTPEFFANRNPFGPEVQLALNTWIIAILPNLTPEGYEVTYIRLQDRNPDVYNMNSIIKIADMAINLSLRQQGTRSGHIIIVDLEGRTMGHLLKCSVMTIKKFIIYMQSVVPLNFRSVHFVNSVPFMEKIFALIRPFQAKKYRDVLHVHYGDNSSIFKYVPKNILPIECGGAELCVTDYYINVFRKELERNGDYFKRQEEQLVDETKRPGKPINLNDLFGVEGTFIKLNVD